MGAPPRGGLLECAMTSRKQKPLLDKAQAAIRNADAGAMAGLLADGLDPNGRLPTHDAAHPGELLLTAVVRRGLYRNQSYDMVRTLLEHGAKTSLVRDQGVDILDHALACENNEFLLFLIPHMETLYHPKGPARYCGRVYNPAILEAMVDRGMSREDVESWLWEAALDNTPEGPAVVRWMAEHGYSLDATQTPGGETPLQSLLRNASGGEGEMAIIGAMVEQGASLDGIDVDALNLKIRGMAKLADEIRARQQGAALKHLTPAAAAQRAARRI